MELCAFRRLEDDGEVMEKRGLDLLKIALVQGLGKQKSGDEWEGRTANDREEAALSSFYVGILPEGEPSEVLINFACTGVNIKLVN